MSDKQAAQQLPKRKQKKKFSQSEEDKIIEFYSKHEHLWDPKHPDYKIGVKSMTIQTLVEEFENRFTASEIHHRFSGMRSTYRLNVNKVNASIGTGSDGRDVYVPTWPHFESLKFLDASKPTRSSHSSFTIQNSSNSQEDWDKESDEIPASGESVNLDEERNSEGMETSMAGSSGGPPIKPKGTKTKRARDEQLIDECLSVLRSVNQENVEPPVRKDTSDRCVMYGEYVAASLREMTSWNQIQAMSEISNVLLKYDRNNPNNV